MKNHWILHLSVLEARGLSDPSVSNRDIAGQIRQLDGCPSDIPGVVQVEVHELANMPTDEDGKLLRWVEGNGDLPRVGTFLRTRVKRSSDTAKGAGAGDPPADPPGEPATPSGGDAPAGDGAEVAEPVVDPLTGGEIDADGNVGAPPVEVPAGGSQPEDPPL